MATSGKKAVSGVELTYVEDGAGVPVLFVHGAFSDHRYWEAHRATVASRYRFIAIDQRYFGTAPWTDAGERFTPETHVADLAAFILALGAGPVFLVGQSYGSAISLLTAIAHPALVRGLFINEPPASTILTDPADKKAAFDDRQGMAAVRAVDAGDAPEATRRFFDFVNNLPGAFDALPPAAKAMRLDNARTVPLQLNAPTIQVTCAQAAQLKIPVTVTRGEFTRVSSALIAAAVSRCVPGARLITIPGGRHGSPVQQAERFNAALLEFLAQH
jgi:pimeloyl-ACP methyl ester carboxylesterase